jgi:hypothetical protein
LHESTSCKTCTKCPASFQGSTPTTSIDRVCSSCVSGQYQANNEYEGTSCKAWTKCDAGQKGTTPTTSVNRFCSVCQDGKYQGNNLHTGDQCKPWTKCDAGQKGTTPTTSVNRVCSVCESGKYQIENDFEEVSCVSHTFAFVEVSTGYEFLLTIFLFIQIFSPPAPSFLLACKRTFVRKALRSLPCRLCAQRALVENTKI